MTTTGSAAYDIQVTLNPIDLGRPPTDSHFLWMQAGALGTLLNREQASRVHVHPGSENPGRSPLEILIFNAEHGVSRSACGASR